MQKSIVQYSTLQYSTVLLLRSSSGQMIGGIGVSGSSVENDKIVAEAAGKITNIKTKPKKYS